MELLRLEVPLSLRESVPAILSTWSSPVMVDCTDADVVIALSSLAGQLLEPVGVWLHASRDYPSQLIARDVATLSWLLPLEHVVVHAESDAHQHAEVVRALLTNDEVNFHNDVATLREAYNRPAPPRSIEVWSWDEVTLRSSTHELHRSSSEPHHGAVLTRFGD